MSLAPAIKHSFWVLSRTSADNELSRCLIREWLSWTIKAVQWLGCLFSRLLSHFMFAARVVFKLEFTNGRIQYIDHVT